MSRSFESRVFQHIQDSGMDGRTVTELQAATGFGVRTIRRHLATLVKSGRVRSGSLLSEGEVGQPPKIYFVKEGT